MEVALVPISDRQNIMWCPSETIAHWETAAFTKTEGCAYPQASSCPQETKWTPVTVTPSMRNLSTQRWENLVSLFKKEHQKLTYIL